MTDHPADRLAFNRLCAVMPVFEGIAAARDRIPFPERTLLHAGPPFRAGGLVAPVRNSAAVAAVFEGWASDFNEAQSMLEQGGIRLAPAQDFGAVVPLAAVLSPGMQVQVVGDGNQPAAPRFYSPLNGGNGPALRLGMCSPDVLSRLRWINGELADTIRAAIDAPLPLMPIADRALAEGDDGHGRTVAATRHLGDVLMPCLPGDDAGQRVRAFLEESPGFFLNLWMAACKAMLAAAQVPGSSIVTAAGGNGIDFGIQLGGLPGQWHAAPALPPRGPLMPGSGMDDHLPAIGDSAVVDAAGFGAMALHCAPEQAKMLEAFMPRPSIELSETLLMDRHPGFVRVPVRAGLAARRAVASNESFAVALGILDRTGVRGRIGGGIAVAPAAALSSACAALERLAQTAESVPSVSHDH